LDTLGFVVALKLISTRHKRTQKIYSTFKRWSWETWET